MTWRTLAACRGRPPEWWHPPPDRVAANYAKARPICQACPVRQACLEYALATDDPHNRCGMYGGYTAKDRERIANGVTLKVAA
jgi:WhiB family redox-sensing transcriptional regulator